MKIDILTIFPSMFDGFLNTSIIKRAREKGFVDIQIHDIRSYSTDAHKRVDDYGYGGGRGMVLMPQPIFDAVDDIKTDDSLVILMTPQGKQYKQKFAYDLSRKKHLILICGHYEGFDERIRSLADIEISIGDYVLTGGELASMVVTDSIVRLIDGVIEKESHLNDSFNSNLLDYPVYTKPANFRGMKVPDVLLSGHHANIEKFRKEAALKKTTIRRPDLLENGDIHE
ncbi:MAG: tRNA (guanosine(37)-N1)-methyltransferase TrmD [Bacilli bacterium]|nr:tRNA (guanosine(37)-N1)-methyltransferase TrmD [Bacilli bacterium]